MEQNSENKPTLLKAIELVLAEPAVIKKEALLLKEKYYRKFSDKKNETEIDKIIIDKIISNYSYYTAFVGGSTALTGVIPGLGTAVATFGGATADAALSMKYQIEMTMAIATICGHNIEIEEEKRLCVIIAGLGTINEAAKEGGKQIGAKAFKKMSFSTSHIGAMAALVDVDKMTHEDAAKKWLADNKSVWTPFTK